ncbi:MAG: hypothetical protein H6753_05325 [Candidatus Omnitrophica bacterium]|nr:hypothetical protein [Candidatus Omnitrophota bacterium]
MMKFYRIRYDKILPIYFVLIMLSFSFVLKSDFKLWELILIFVSSSTMLIIIVSGHAQTIVVSDKGISLSSVVMRKIISCPLFIKWEDVWKVSQSYNPKTPDFFFVVPYKRIKGIYQFKLREMVNVTSFYKNYEEILIDVVNNAKNADIDDSVFKKIQEYKDKSSKGRTKKERSKIRK